MLRNNFVRGVQKAGQEAGLFKSASEEDDRTKVASVVLAMEEQDMAVPSEEDLQGAAEVVKALAALEAERGAAGGDMGSPADEAAAADAAQAVEQVKEVTAELTGAKLPEQAKVPAADSGLQSVNENQDSGTSGSNSVVSGGETGSETPNTPPAQAAVAPAASGLQSTNENENPAAGTTQASNSPVEGGEVGDDKSEKTASLLGDATLDEVTNRLKGL